MNKKIFILSALASATFSSFVAASELPNFKSVAKNQLGNQQTRIIGGDKSEEGRYPFMTALTSASDSEIRPFCGASYIGGRYVLTASHCVDGSSASGIAVWIGGYDITKPDSGKKIAVTQIYMHEDYDANTINKDVAILELAEDVTGVTPIKIVTPEIDGTFAEGDSFTVMGWGNRDAESDEGDFPNILHEVNVPLYNRQACLDAYQEEGSASSDITEFMMCAGLTEGGKDSCQGDSGGPLVFKRNDEWYQAGVVSFGNGCAVAGQPGIYSRLAKFNDWIEQKTAGVSYTQTMNRGFVENTFDENISFTFKNVSSEPYQVSSVALENVTNLAGATVAQNGCEGKSIGMNESCDIAVNVKANTTGQGSFSLKAEANNSANTTALISFSTHALEPTSLDMPELVGSNADIVTWYSGGDAIWEAQTSKVVTGDNAISSGEVGDFEASVLLGIIDSPKAKKLSLKYLVSSEEGYDFLTIKLNNNQVLEASGQEITDFTDLSLELAEGKNRLSISYAKDSGDIGNDGEPLEVGEDKAFIDDVSIEIANLPPVSKVKEMSISVEEEKQFTLDASESTDPENDTMTYKWELVGTGNVTIDSPNEATTTVTAPKFSDATSLQFKVTVTDAQNASHESKVDVTITQKPAPAPAPTPTPTPAPTPTPTPAPQSSSGGSMGWGAMALLGLLIPYRRRHTK